MANHKRKEVSNRLSRIGGHIRAIGEMLDDGRSYPEVVHQVMAVRAALDGVVKVIVDDLVEDCVAKAERKEPMTGSLVELRQVVSKTR